MSHLRPRRWLIVALGSLLASLAVAVAPSPAGASPVRQPSDTLLFSSQLTVTSSTGRTLFLSMFVDRFSAAPPVSTSLQIGLGDNAGESHDWELNVMKHTFSYDMTTHRGAVRTGRSQIAPLGFVNLAITPRGKGATRHCGGGNSWIRQPVTVVGTIVFMTHSRTWGRVGSRKHRLTFKGHSEVETDYGSLGSSCFGGRLAACAGAVDWNNAGGDRGGFSGESYRLNGKLHGAVDFGTERSIAAPQGAARDDDAEIVTRPPHFTVRPDGTAVVSIHAGPHGLLTGSATLRSIGPPKTISDGCRGGTTKVWTASYTPGANPLTVHLDIGGTFSQRAQPTGGAISIDSR